MPAVWSLDGKYGFGLSGAGAHGREEMAGKTKGFAEDATLFFGPPLGWPLRERSIKG